MSETIDLAHMDDAQFDSLYRARIEPLFLEGDRERAGAVSTFRTRLSIGAPLAIALGLGVGFGFAEPAGGLIAGAIAMIVAYTVAYLPLQKLADRMKAAVLNAIAEAIGVSYRSDVAPLAMPRFLRLGLAPSYDRCKFEDDFHGERQGCGFDLWEAHLETETRDKDGKRSYSTVFRGVMIRIAFPKKFLGVTVVRRDAGIFNALRGLGEMKRVGLGDSRFERAFEVYSTDQVEARYLVHPVFMERLLQLEGLFNGRHVRCGFDEGDLLVAIEADNKFEIGDMFKPLADPARARRIIDDIAGVLKLMDAVLTAELAPLVGRARP